jgi:hypothetical protein
MEREGMCPRRLEAIYLFICRTVRQQLPNLIYFAARIQPSTRANEPLLNKDQAEWCHYDKGNHAGFSMQPLNHGHHLFSFLITLSNGDTEGYRMVKLNIYSSYQHERTYPARARKMLLSKSVDQEIDSAVLFSIEHSTYPFSK